MISKDLALDSNNNLRIESGDLAIDQTDDQNIEGIMLAEKGQFYQNPLLGYGLNSKLFGNFVKLKERMKIRRELLSDFYKIKQLTIDDTDQITIDISAEKIK